MDYGGIGALLCAAAALCGYIIQKDYAKEENIRLEILVKVDMLKDTNDLHIEGSQRIGNAQQYFKDEIIADEKRNHDTDTIQMNIAFHSKELKQYQVCIHSGTGESGRIDTVLQLKNDALHVYIVSVDNTYERIQETLVTSKDRENFLSSLPFRKYRKEAKDYFRHQKQEQDVTTVCTVELTNNEKSSECINKTDNKRGDAHFEELKLSYTISGFENKHETALLCISGYSGAGI